MKYILCTFSGCEARDVVVLWKGLYVHVFLLLYTFMSKILHTKSWTLVYFAPEVQYCFMNMFYTPRLDFRRFLKSGLRSSSAGSFPEQWLLIEPIILLVKVERSVEINLLTINNLLLPFISYNLIAI